VEHFYVKFGDPSCICFSRYRAENRQMEVESKNPTPRPPSDSCLPWNQPN